MSKNFLDKRFKHSRWFTEGVTVGYALEDFAKCSDMVLDKKIAKQQSSRLFDDLIYDDIIRYTGKEKGFYKLSPEEKEYYLERKKYWDDQKEIENQKWLNTEINVDDELEKWLNSNSNYDTNYCIKQINNWKNSKGSTEEEINEYVKRWENRLKERIITKGMIDNYISLYKDKIKTNKDFIEFRDFVYDKLDEYKNNKAS